jgi:DNA polymerase-3 subunit gamma/tau
MQDLVALSEKHRDSLMKVSLTRYIRPVKIEPGRMEISLTEGAPRSLPGDLQRRLLDWTGKRWVVTISSTPGAPTLAEAADARHTALVTDAIADPEVAAILQQFPGAKVIDVRLRGDAASEAEAVLALYPGSAGGADFTPEPPLESDDDDL